MQRVPLTAEQHMTLAKVVRVGCRWVLDNRCDPTSGEAVGAVHAITRDTVVLGVALGTALAATELDGWKSYHRLAELYRAAGADEQVAAAEFTWHLDNRSGLRSRLDSSATPQAEGARQAKQGQIPRPG